MFRHLSYIGFTCGLLAMSAPAIAGNCAKRDVVVDRLQAKFSEQLAAGGLQASRSTSTTTLVEVWASPETGTFTVMLTNPGGISCIVATGTDWFQQVPEKQLAGTPS